MGGPSWSGLWNAHAFRRAERVRAKPVLRPGGAVTTGWRARIWEGTARLRVGGTVILDRNRRQRRRLPVFSDLPGWQADQQNLETVRVGVSGRQPVDPQLCLSLIARPAPAGITKAKYRLDNSSLPQSCMCCALWFRHVVSEVGGLQQERCMSDSDFVAHFTKGDGDQPFENLVKMLEGKTLKASGIPWTGNPAVC